MVSVARVDDGVRRGFEVTSGLTIMFGARTSATTTVGSGREGVRSSVDVQRSLPSGTGYGYQLRMSDGLTALPSVVAQAQGPHGRYEVRADSSGGRTHTTVSVAGAVVAIGGGLFTTRPVRGSYALVQVPGVKDVRGYSSNQEIGRTDDNGNFFVPDLLPYYGNLLNIADTDVPIDFTISKVQATVAPPYRGGALVRFPVQRIQRSQGRVLIVSGGVERTPTYGQLTVTADGVPSVSPLGTGGEFYFENLPAGRHTAVVEAVDGVCRFVIEVPPSDGAVADLGIVRCKGGEER
jgi:outer membrane usher protein